LQFAIRRQNPSRESRATKFNEDELFNIQQQQHEEDINSRGSNNDDKGDPPFNKDGHEYIGQRIRYRLEDDEHMDGSYTFGEYKYIDGTIIGYLSPDDKDSKGDPAFCSLLTKQPAYLFQVLFDNGIKDDLEEHEIEEKCTWINNHINNSRSDVDTDNDDNTDNNSSSDSSHDSDFDDDCNLPGARDHTSSKAKTKSTSSTCKGKPHDKKIQLYTLQLFVDHPNYTNTDVLILLKDKFKEYKRIQYLNRTTVSRWRINKKNIKNSSSINYTQYTDDERQTLLNLPDNLERGEFHRRINKLPISNNRSIRGLFKQYKKVKRINKTTHVDQLNIDRDLALYSITQNESESDSFYDDMINHCTILHGYHQRG
jgi:hypothetical protein